MATFVGIPIDLALILSNPQIVLSIREIDVTSPEKRLLAVNIYEITTLYPDLEAKTSTYGG